MKSYPHELNLGSSANGVIGGVGHARLNALHENDAI